MDRQVLIRDMKKFVDGASFITRNQLAKYLKRSRNNIPDLVQGLEYIESGSIRQYFVPDVVGKLLEDRKC